VQIFWVWISIILYQFSWGGASGFPYITKKAFETARLVMGRRNVDFDEKNCFRACFESKNGEK
jgi:hypothetical protein